MSEPFASSADLGEEEILEVPGVGVYALTAGGDPDVGAVEGEGFVVSLEARATPVMAQQWPDKLREHADMPVTYPVLAATGSCIEMRRESGVRPQTDAAFDRAGAERTSAFEPGTPDAVARYAGLVLGTGLVPVSAARAATRVAVLALDDPEARHPIGLVHRASRSPELLHFGCGWSGRCSPGE